MNITALGERTNKKFLTGLIPDHYKEIVFKSKTHWACCVDGQLMEFKDWKKIEEEIKEAFGDNLLEISKNGARFIVYLRKDK